MELENEKRASILSDALPYIQQYSNKVVVVKYGGNAMTNDKLKQAVMSDLVLLSLCGIKIVLVHGGTRNKRNAEKSRQGEQVCKRPSLHR